VLGRGLQLNREAIPVPRQARTEGHRFQAGSYEFTPIASTGDRFTDFVPYVPAVNNLGVVAFQATLRAGGSGVFAGSGGQLSSITVVPMDSVRDVCSHPDIDDRGSACYYANLTSGRRAVVLVRDGRISTLVGNAGPLGPTINEHGTMAYRTGAESEATGIFTRSDGLVTPIAATGEVFSAFLGLPVINGRGRVAFRADLASGGQGVYTGDGGPPVVVAQTGRIFSDLGQFPVMDDAGSVAFCASLAGGGSGVFVASAGDIETIIDTSGAFESFRGVLLAEEGGLIFYATPRGGKLGVFCGPDPERDCLLSVGAPFLGSTVVDFALNPVSINRVGQIAIRVKLANNEQFVLRADPRGRQPAVLAARVPLLTRAAVGRIYRSSIYRRP